MNTAVIITIILLILILVVSLATLYTESRKRIKRLEGRIERLSYRIQAMSMKELDVVLKSMQYRKERDELCEILDEINHTVEAMEDGRQIKIMPKLPRTPISHLDKPNRVVSYEWGDGKTKYTSYYTYNPSHDSTNTNNTPSQDSSNYTGGGGDFSGGGSGGSWD